MNNASIELDLVELLKAIHSNINQRILAASKIVAKNFFRELADGKALPFMEITSPELGDVSCDLALDHTKFIGTMNVLVTGIEQRTAGNMTVRLMFLDPQQFSVRAN